MSDRDAHGRIWLVILKTAGIGAIFVWFGFIGGFEHLDATRPVKPDSATGRIIPQNNHGHFVYLTEKEEGRLLALERISMGLFLVAGVAAYFYKKATGKLPG